eukprot:scpid54027/ scgid0520/ 
METRYGEDRPGPSSSSDSVSPLSRRKGPLAPVLLPGSQRNPRYRAGALGNSLPPLDEPPAVELRLPSITNNTEKTTQPLRPAPLRPGVSSGDANEGRCSPLADVDRIERCPSPLLTQRRKSLSPAKRSGGGGASSRLQRSPEPIRRIASAESSSNDDIPSIYLGSATSTNGSVSSSSSAEYLSESYPHQTTSSMFRASRSGSSSTSSHITSLRDFSSLSRSLPSLTEEESPRRTSAPAIHSSSLLGARLPRSGSFESELSSHHGDSRLGRHRHHSNPSAMASKSLAGSMASPMTSRRRPRQPSSPTPLSLGDLSPDMAAGMLYSRECATSSRRRSKTVSPEPIPEDDIAPSPSVLRRRSPSPQPPVHASGIPVSPLATSGPARHVSVPTYQSLMVTSPRRTRPNNVNILSRSISPGRASSLDSGEEQSLTGALSPVKELEADDEDSDGCLMPASMGRTSRSRSLGEVDVLTTKAFAVPSGVSATVKSNMTKSATLDELQSSSKFSAPPPLIRSEPCFEDDD